MRTWAKGTAPAALLAVAVMTVGSGTAAADTGGNGSVGGGNQVSAPVNLPIDISGNAVGVLGESSAGSQGGATVVNGGSGTGGNRTSGDGSVLGGNQIDAPINAPINACGNAIAVLGEADANCKGGATVVNRGHGAGGDHTSGDGSVLGGNQVVAPVTAPLNACGNALAIFGNATAGCTGGSTVKNSGAGAGAGGNRTSGGGSVLGGNQVVAPISAPTDICGNAVAVLGGAFGSCKGGATVINGGPHSRNHHHHRTGPHGSAGNDTDGRFGVGSGNQLIAPIDLPVEVCGNAVGGDASANCKGGATVVKRGRGAGGNRTSGQGGVLAGNQAVAPVTAPIDICGNAVALLGEAFAGCKGGATVVNGGRGAGGNRTSGQGGVLAGNQAVAPVTAPINVCGNAAAVLGKAAAQCKGGAHVWPGRGGVGGGGNSTSGDGSVLGGNQVVAPITAPANICGNAVAVLGDAAAGCLGGSKVGGPGGHPGDHYGRQHVRGLAPVDAEGVGSGGTAGGDLLSTLPAAPALTKTPVVSDVTGGTALPGVRDVTSLTGQTEGLGLPPAVGDVTKTEGLGLPPAAGDATKALGAPEPGDLTGQATRTLGVPDAGSALSTLPQLPGLPVLAETPVGKSPAGQGTAEQAPAGKGGKAGKSARSGKAGKATRKMSSRPVPGGRGDDRRRPKGGALSVAEPATDLVGSTPAGGAVRDTAEGLPVKGLPVKGLGANGLMSAEQPLGVTGMNSGALAALMLGAMFALSATLLAGIRRLRFGRRP
ncbi:chaplin family protein [Spongiactinospora sp. 9N601]|uniref:chaplin family protein n=1 Tax=Spongiactinospora sp. 9N601 TaxID=3375149 RepID=UPI0037AC1E7A